MVAVYFFFRVGFAAYVMPSHMNHLTILSCNVQGLNFPHKRVSLLDFLRRKKVDIAFLQESHFLQKDITRINNKYFTVLASSSYDKKTRGVMIVAKCSLNLTKLGSGWHAEGRITFVKTIIEERKVAFVSIYAPNRFDNSFFELLNNMLLDVSDFCLVMGAILMQCGIMC